MLNDKKTIVIILASLTVLVIGIFGYLRYAKFCQPTLESDAYMKIQVERGIVVRASNPAIIRELDAGLKEAKRKMSWGQWWLDTRLSGCRKIFPPQPFPTLPTPFMPTTTPTQPPPQTQAPADTRSWGERFRDKTIPEVKGVTWQTYTNKEYGFEMEYPKGMEIETGKSSQAESSYIHFDLPLRRPYNAFMTIVIYPKSLREIFQGDLYVVYRHKLENMTPDAIINELGIVISGADENPDSNGSNALAVYLEKYGHSYYLGESGHDFNDTQDYKIVEHMIKTLHFLK